ncbi:MAG TPA: hypothetical protein VFL27_09630 [Candidatus Dormibacteraeota bacterium]|nr:hypothetical protein [Candidatus Dormibacteraeota bacterium]
MNLPLDLGWIGIWLLVVSAVAVVVELVLMGMWSVRLGRKSKALTERLMEQQAGLQADVERLHASIAETQALWRPYRRALRWLRHPIAIALIQSYARRRAAAR